MKLRALRTPAFAALVLASACPAFAGDDPVVAIRHDVFVTTDVAPDACERATSTVITVEEDTVVQYCFVVRNIGTVALTIHDVVTDSFGRLDSMLPLTVAPGATAYRSHLDVVTDDRTTTATWIARDIAPQYTPSPTTHEFTDISTTGTRLLIYGWDAATVTMPFAATLYGKRSPYISICNLGMIELDSFRGFCHALPEALPSGWSSYAMMPFWARLGWFMGGVYTQTVGAEPHRRQIVQWRRELEFGGAPDGNGVTFQAILSEDDDRIVFLYPDVTLGVANGDNGQAAVIGMNYDANLAQMYSHFSPVLTNGQAIAWTPNVWRTTQASNSATVIVHAAKIAVSPPAIDVTQAAGIVAERRVAIGNTGEVPLQWRLGEAQTASTAHIPKHARPYVAKPGPERIDLPREARAARRTPPPASTPITRGPKLPTGYGRDNGAEEFVKIDLSTGLVTPVSSVQETPVASVDFLGGDFSRLYSNTGTLPSQSLLVVDPSDGRRISIVPSQPPAGEGWTGITGDSSTGALFGAAADLFVDYDGNVHCGPNAYLYRLNPDVGTPRRIGRIGTDLCLQGIATNANGEMFGVDSQSDVLLAIDKTTGAGTVIGPLGVNITAHAGLDFDEAANVLYLAVWNSDAMRAEVRTVDTTTGASSLAVPLARADGQFTYVISLGLESGGRGCVDPADVSWVSVSSTAGTLAPDAQTEVTVRVDATNLGAGRYEALLCIYSNDPRRPFVTLPVRLDIDDETLFRDGFD